MPTFYEFFAGGGMARAGLGDQWKCLFANDFDHKKGQTYRTNWGDSELLVDDIRQISASQLPQCPDLVWGSFPCQDLSLAGGGAGLNGDRSGTFWPFIEQIRSLKAEGRAPALIAVENVVGTITSHSGADFTAICSAFNSLGYKYGALVADAAHFVPQSRPRLFVIAIRSDLEAFQTAATPSDLWHTKALRKAHSLLSRDISANWVWWSLPAPQPRSLNLIDIIEESPNHVEWHSQEATEELLRMMSNKNLEKVRAAQASGKPTVGTVYKRTRYQNGQKVQRAEIRFDDIAGCLRTPAGGSSRQLILMANGKEVRSRLMSARETARLMGLPDEYILPHGYNEAYHLTGDGVAVPVVRYIAHHLLEPLLAKNEIRIAA
jgi:DNA (cytosine-5)-methyltransferase 1